MNLCPQKFKKTVPSSLKKVLVSNVSYSFFDLMSFYNFLP